MRRKLYFPSFPVHVTRCLAHSSMPAVLSRWDFRQEPYVQIPRFCLLALAARRAIQANQRRLSNLPWRM